MKRAVGQTPCPECGETETVMHDGRKYYIQCAACGAFINYQSSAAKARIEAKLKPVDTGPAEPEPPEISETPSPELVPEKPKTAKPYKPARESERAERGLFGSYDDWF